MHELIDDFDLTWSRFRSDGAVEALRRGEVADLGVHAATLWAHYDRLVRLTSGAVNPLVGGALEALGYDAEYRLAPVVEATAPAPDWALALRDGSALRLPAGTVLDVGAVGKGLLVDLVAAELGCPAVVDAGGDLLNAGTESVQVALEHPRDPSRAVGVVELAPGRAIAGSATNRRAWGEDLHHVLDARTGRPMRGVHATWALAASAAEADAAASATFFRPAVDVAAAYPGSHVVRFDSVGLTASSDLPGELFT